MQGLPDQSSTGTLGSAAHTYADNGNYTVSVTVTDKDGGKDTKSFMVAVANVKPTITSFSGTDYLAGANAFVGGGGVASTLTTRFTDPGSDSWTGAFTYQDGSPLTETRSPFATGQQVNHTFASPGCKSAGVKVTDDDGGSDTASTTIKIGSGAFQPPMTNQPVTDKLKNGQVLPVKVHVNDCSGAAATTLTPAIRLVKGDLTPQSDDTATTITPPSVSAADTTGVMRSLGGGDYTYNMQVSLQTLNADYTVVVYPYGTGSPVELGHVIQATK
jgi:PKD repeat protein